MSSKVALVDEYCERISGDYGHDFGEPLNTITNIAFIIAAIYLVKSLKHLAKKISLSDFDIIILIISLFSIGIGSTAYHAKPNDVTLLMDVLPITLFIHLYLVSFFVRVVGVRWYIACLILFGFIFIGFWFGKTFDSKTLNGTIMYIPAFLTLLAMTTILAIRKDQFFKPLFITSVLWALSLFFRTIDSEICDLTFGLGVHGIWHILNAIVLFRLTAILISKRNNGFITS